MNRNTVLSALIVGGAAMAGAAAIAMSSGYNPLHKYATVVSVEPAFEATQGPLWDRVYRGQPGVFEQELGFQHHGSTTYEWIRVLKGPTVYDEALKAHGEGFHHLAFDVKDIDKAVADWTARGAVVLQSGGWGTKGQPGSGRFAYLDTDAFGGILVELLWNRP